MSKEIIIAGAGLTGLIAAHAFRGSQVQEAASEEDVTRNEHAALLRFRSDTVSRITGIPFREVLVHKSVWDGQRHVELNMALANAYAAKVLAATGGKISGRSIWNLDAVKRFIAPPDFISRMRHNLRDRVLYDHPVDLSWHWNSDRAAIVSTIPLPTLLSLAAAHESWNKEAWAFEAGEFKCASITVSRYKLEGVDLHQTVYFPGPETGTYRASITGDVLIVEGVGGHEMSADDLLRIFGLDVACNFLDAKIQKYGKIIDIPATRRRQLLRKLTESGGVYTLGRFATWRNVLLDDVANDIEVIRRLVDSDAYGRELA